MRCLLVALLLLPAAVGTTHAFAPDVVFVQQAVESGLASPFAALALEAGDTLLVRSASEDKKDWLLEDALIRLALERGVHVVRAAENRDTAHARTYALTFRLVGLALNAFPEHRGLLRRAMTTRQVRFDAFLSLTDRSGHVVRTCWARTERSDCVPSGYDARLEDTGFLARNVVEGQSKLTELVVVTGVVGSLVYLLF